MKPLDHRELARRIDAATSGKKPNTVNPLADRAALGALRDDLKALAKIVAEERGKGQDQAEKLSQAMEALEKVQRDFQVLNKNAGGMLEQHSNQIKQIQNTIDQVIKALQAHDESVKAHGVSLDSLKKDVLQAVENQLQINRWLPIAMILTVVGSTLGGMIVSSKLPQQQQTQKQEVRRAR